MSAIKATTPITIPAIAPPDRPLSLLLELELVATLDTVAADDQTPVAFAFIVCVAPVAFDNDCNVSLNSLLLTD